MPTSHSTTPENIFDEFLHTGRQLRIALFQLLNNLGSRSHKFLSGHAQRVRVVNRDLAISLRREGRTLETATPAREKGWMSTETPATDSLADSERSGTEADGRRCQLLTRRLRPLDAQGQDSRNERTVVERSR